MTVTVSFRATRYGGDAIRTGLRCGSRNDAMLVAYLHGRIDSARAQFDTDTNTREIYSML